MNATGTSFLTEGDLFRGYRVVRLLGQGGMGAVYLVHHEVLDSDYALKILDPEVVVRDASHVKRFLREARLASRIRHPNLVAVHDCGLDSATNLYYLVMDYVEGGSLRDMLAFCGTLDVARAADIVFQVASALQAAQTFSVVHRDIKPENILVQPDGRVKLVDLGVAKAQNLGDSVRTSTDSVFGTPAYISPEQAQCSAEVDLRADIYSLGIVFFEMLVGRCPYEGRNTAMTLAQILSDVPTPDIRDFKEDIPPGIAILVRRMTMKNIDERPDSFDCVLEELARMGYAKSAPTGGEVQFPNRHEPSMKTLLSSVETLADDTKREVSKKQPKVSGIFAKVQGIFTNFLTHA